MKQSELIKELRGGLTQEEFAKMVGEYDKAVISRYERGAVAISLPKFLDWCEKMNKGIKLK